MHHSPSHLIGDAFSSSSHMSGEQDSYDPGLASGEKSEHRFYSEFSPDPTLATRRGVRGRPAPPRQSIAEPHDVDKETFLKRETNPGLVSSVLDVHLFSEQVLRPASLF